MTAVRSQLAIIFLLAALATMSYIRGGFVDALVMLILGTLIFGRRIFQS